MSWPRTNDGSRVTSRTSAISTVTRSSIPAMFAGLPPYAGISESTRVTFAPSSTSRHASVEPMNPSPPVMSTFCRS